MRSGTKWLLAGIGGLLVVAAVAAAVVTGVRYWSMSAQESARDEALVAARDYTGTLFSRDPKTVSDNINKSMGFLTGSAKNEYQKNVVDYKIADTVRKDKIVAVTKIQGAGVMQNTRDTAKVLVYMNLSTTRNTNEEEVQIDPSRIVYDMVKRDGTWMISAIDILDDDSLKSRIEQSDGPVPSGAVPIPSPPSASDAPAPTSSAPSP